MINIIKKEIKRRALCIESFNNEYGLEMS